MNTVCDINKCNACMACVDICPKKCISVVDNIYSCNAVKDSIICIKCGMCEKICPRKHKVKKEKPIKWYQGWASDTLRIKAASGGAASAIMKAFIENNGYVAACLFKEGKFQFQITNDLEVVKKCAGSKYVKSDPHGIYALIEERLKTDKVLFVGLPCQVAGIRNYIKDQDNLYTADLICHGTPSSKLLIQFLSEHSIDIKAINDIRFRDKTDFGLIIDKVKLCHEGKDDYMMAFLNSVDYTENCYYCDYATFERVSDITLGDSWGTELYEEEKNGISLLLIQNKKGKELLNLAEMELKPVNIEHAVAENQQLQHPSIIKKSRKLFMKMLSIEKSISLISFCLFPNYVLKRRIKKCLFIINKNKIEKFNKI